MFARLFWSSFPLALLWFWSLCIAIAPPWYAFIIALTEIITIMLTKYVSLQIRERKEKKKQSQDDTAPLVDRDLEKNTPPPLEEGQEPPQYPQPAVVHQRPDRLSCGPWLPVYFKGRRLDGYGAMCVYH